jgi:hypothetical protein
MKFRIDCRSKFEKSYGISKLKPPSEAAMIPRSSFWWDKTILICCDELGDIEHTFREVGK